MRIISILCFRIFAALIIFKMSIIKLPLFFEGSLGEKTLYTLFDSGASFSCISLESVTGLEKLIKMRRPLEIATAAKGAFLKIEYRIVLDFYYNDIRLSDEFMVIEGLSEDAIIGVNTL